MPQTVFDLGNGCSVELNAARSKLP